MPNTKDFPATLIPFSILSGGYRMIARVLVAEGEGPHPTAVFLHGLPGNDHNFDLAHSVRRSGWNALVFHYRGSWGSEGSYSLSNVVADTSAAIEFVRGETARAYRCDSSRIALIGHSTGGFAGLIAATREPGPCLKGVASLAGFNFGAEGELFKRDLSRRKLWTDALSASILPLKGVTGEGLVSEIMEKSGEFQLESTPGLLTQTPLHFIWCSNDVVSVPEIHHHPLMKAFESTERKAPFEVTCLDTDHYISSFRLELADALTRWLRSLE